MSIFEEVKQQLNIRQVIEHYGFKVYKGKLFVCPFHNDHKPSASIKNDYFHCFVCGAGGDLITFTAKHLGISNLDAAKELINVFSLNIEISTPEERKSQYIAQKQREKKQKEEIKACGSLRDKFLKDKEYRTDVKNKSNYKLRNDIRKTRSIQEQNKEAYINEVGLLLADVHRLLWQGVNFYPYESERHIIGAQELTICEYYLQCYEENPEEFCLLNVEVINKYERMFDKWNKQG